MSDLERALNDLEASLSTIWEQADAEYVARHYPWHTAGPACAAVGDHVHAASGRVFYWPPTVEVDPPS